MENNRKILNAILREDFKSFVIKVFNTVSSGTKYLDNWHVNVICDDIMDMIEGQNNRLIINIPPRNMKSIICSVALPAYLLGKNPKTNIICVSYSDDLSSKFANDCRNVMQSDWYNELFPMTKLKKNRNAINDFETTHSGGRMATSIGGMLTGRGADWIIIDDPLKPADAMSDTQRDKVNDWYGSTLYSRLNDKATGKILLIMQRLHQNDLTGFLLESDANFKLIKLPIIAEQDEEWKIKKRFLKNTKIVKRTPGDLLHPERENISIITDLRNSLGEFAFAGQYQQRPSPVEGGLIKKEWFNFYNELPKLKKIILSWDTASKTGIKNAFSSCVILGIGTDKKIYLLECYRDRLEFPDLINKMKEKKEVMHKKYGVLVYTLIEEASSGIQAIQQLKTNNHNDTIIGAKPSSDKISRLVGISPYIENGTILFPTNAGYWWRDFEKELLTFPASTFKDQCDALSQGIDYASGELHKRDIREMFMNVDVEPIIEHELELGAWPKASPKLDFLL